MIKVYGTLFDPSQPFSVRNPAPLLDTLRQAELASLAHFVLEHRDKLRGRVLDFGAGKPGTCRKPEPYRDLVDGEYVPFDLGDEMKPGPYDAILCTQVVQYLHGFANILSQFQKLLYARNGHLVLTYPTNWPEVEAGDMYRYTKTGMENMLQRSGFEILDHEQRAALVLPPNTFATGYGLVARPAKA